jgi:ElaB/YqjD/DUF883 family membrane-anchored ribosome-binding protein
LKIRRLIYSDSMRATDLTDRLHDLQKKAGDRAREVGRVADDYVHENTWTSVALAAAVGCLIGFLIGNRRD